MFTFQTILVPTDFSACSRFAFRLAAQLARAHGSRLVVLHVMEAPDPMVAYSGRSEHERSVTRARLQEILGRYQVPEGTAGVDHVLVEGDTADEILRVVDEVGCDLIVMGTHGRTGWDRILLGSIAERIVRRASCPVVTAKVPKEVTVSAPVRSKAVATPV